MFNNPLNARLREFIEEIEQRDLPSVPLARSWRLRDDIENGTDIGSDVASPVDRKVLHDIGQRYRLIPLSPRDVVELEISTGSMSAGV